MALGTGEGYSPVMGFNYLNYNVNCYVLTLKTYIICIISCILDRENLFRGFLFS